MTDRSLTETVENIVDVMLDRRRIDRYLRKTEDGRYYTTADVVFVNQDGPYTPPYVSIPAADGGETDEELAENAVALMRYLDGQTEEN